MSVLPFGAPDFADTGPWDNGSVDYLFTGTSNVDVSSGPIEVSHYGCTYLFCNLTVGSIAVDINWYTDDTLATKIAGREIVCDQHIPAFAQLMTVNLGPWMQVVGTRLPGVGSFTGTLGAMLNNRQPAPAHAEVSAILVRNAPNIAAGATFTTYSSHYHGGPVMMYVNGGSQGVTVACNFLGTNDGNWHPFAQYAVAANIDDMRTLLFPQHAVQMTLTNASGAVANNTATLTATAAIAGSS
jgi:hypothetical protein